MCSSSGAKSCCCRHLLVDRRFSSRWFTLFLLRWNREAVYNWNIILKMYAQKRTTSWMHETRMPPTNHPNQHPLDDDWHCRHRWWHDRVGSPSLRGYIWSRWFRVDGWCGVPTCDMCTTRHTFTRTRTPNERESERENSKHATTTYTSRFGPSRNYGGGVACISVCRRSRQALIRNMSGTRTPIYNGRMRRGHTIVPR